MRRGLTETSVMGEDKHLPLWVVVEDQGCRGREGGAVRRGLTETSSWGKISISL